MIELEVFGWNPFGRIQKLDSSEFTTCLTRGWHDRTVPRHLLQEVFTPETIEERMDRLT